MEVIRLKAIFTWWVLMINHCLVLHHVRFVEELRCLLKKNGPWNELTHACITRLISLDMRPLLIIFQYQAVFMMHVLLLICLHTFWPSTWLVVRSTCKEMSILVRWPRAIYLSTSVACLYKCFKIRINYFLASSF